MLAWLLEGIHIVGFGIALGALWARGHALHGTPYMDDVRRAFVADNLWNIGAILLVGSGIAQLLLGNAAKHGHFLGNHIYMAKLVMIGCIVLLEIMPMFTLIQWRLAVGRGDTIRFGSAALIARISLLQTILLVLITFASVALRQGYGI